MTADHQHRLQDCHECDGEGTWRWADGWPVCGDCDGRGYLRPETCAICREPLGNLRRVWKREGRPDWSTKELVERFWTEERFQRLIAGG
jgi:hypothetical protein